MELQKDAYGVKPHGYAFGSATNWAWLLLKRPDSVAGPCARL